MASSCLRRSRTIHNFIARQILGSSLSSPDAVVGRSPTLPESSHFRSSPLQPSSRGSRAVNNTLARRVFMELGTTQRFKSTEAEKQLESPDEEEEEGSGDHLDYDDDEGMDFPGGRVTFTSEMDFIPGNPDTRVPCYRVLDRHGRPLNNGAAYFTKVNEDIAVKMYSNMVALQTMDVILYEAQRQGRISFYLTATGEEAISIASAAALADHDVVLAQYREAGVLLWRGFTLQQFVDQCFGNKFDYGKGRQMPIHYGSNKHNYFTISSPLATQLPQAAGVAYSLKMEKKDACVVTYTGDGATSEGDFHAGLNFAAVMEAPVVFICRNNGWAISTHINEQFRSDGVVVKGRAYGIPSIRVDGNDALAVYTAVQRAREISVNDQTPVLVEALTYRVGHHSTSDDSTKYRPVDEIDYWKTERNPVSKFRTWVEGNGWWSDRAEAELRASIRNQLLQAIQNAEKTEKPPLSALFADVYDVLPANLREQEIEVREAVKRHPDDYPSDIPLLGSS